MIRTAIGVITLTACLLFQVTAVAQQSRLKRNTSPSWMPRMTLSYSTVSDFNDNHQQRKFAHSLGMGAGWSLSKAMSASVMTGVGYESVDTEIEKTNRSGLTDTMLGLGFQHKFNRRHSFSAQGGVFLPTSETSQYEGQRARYMGALGLRSKVTSWYSIGNRVSGNYVSNTYDYSPTTDQLNRSTSADYSLDNSFSFGKMFASFGLGARITTYQDGISELSYFNVSKLGVRAGGFSGFVAYMNGSYRDDYRLQPLFYDQYKQLAELGLSYEF